MTLIDLLRSFNRKERFFLVGWALDNPGFTLGESFRLTLSRVLGADVPKDAYVAMDYHLDWIYGSVFLRDKPDRQAAFENTGPACISANQEDVDLLVAWETGDGCHLIMVEAKGDTGWTNKQLSSKARRLRQIFGGDGTTWPGVIPHFVIASPRESAGIRCAEWPEFMKHGGTPIWLEMPLAEGLWRITRCDESGRASAGGLYWRTVGPRREAT